MEVKVRPVTKTVVHAVQYRDLPSAIEWLCQAFGFKKHHVVKDAKGRILSAELLFGESIIMLGSAKKSYFDGILIQPDKTKGAATQTCYLTVEDVDAFLSKAREAGADIILDIDDGEDGRNLTCRDLEGHIWNFGSYVPQPITMLANQDSQRSSQNLVGSSKIVALALSLLLFAGVGTIAGTMFYTDAQKTSKAALEQLIIQEQGRRKAAEHKLKDAQSAAQRALATKTAAELAAKTAREQIMHQKRKQELAGRELNDKQEKLERYIAAATIAERKAREAHQQVALEQRKRERAERELEDAQAKLERLKLSSTVVGQPASSANKQKKQKTVSRARDRNSTLMDRPVIFFNSSSF